MVAKSESAKVGRKPASKQDAKPKGDGERNATRGLTAGREGYDAQAEALRPDRQKVMADHGDDYAQLQELLGTSWKDWAVTDKEANQALAILQGQSFAERKIVLEELKKNDPDAFGKLISEVPKATRRSPAYVTAKSVEGDKGYFQDLIYKTPAEVGLEAGQHDDEIVEVLENVGMGELERHTKHDESGITAWQAAIPQGHTLQTQLSAATTANSGARDAHAGEKARRQAAKAGSAQHVKDQGLGKQLESIEDLLSYGALDWKISDKEARQALTILSNAGSPANIEALIFQLEAKGPFVERLVDNVAPNDRWNGATAKAFMTILKLRDPSKNLELVEEMLNPSFLGSVSDEEARLAFAIAKSMPPATRDKFRQIDGGAWWNKMTSNLDGEDASQQTANFYDNAEQVAAMKADFEANAASWEPARVEGAVAMFVAADEADYIEQELQDLGFDTDERFNGLYEKFGLARAGGERDPEKFAAFKEKSLGQKIGGGLKQVGGGAHAAFDLMGGTLDMDAAEDALGGDLAGMDVANTKEKGENELELDADKKNGIYRGDLGSLKLDGIARFSGTTKLQTGPVQIKAGTFISKYPTAADASSYIDISIGEILASDLMLISEVDMKRLGELRAEAIHVRAEQMEGVEPDAKKGLMVHARRSFAHVSSMVQDLSGTMVELSETIRGGEPDPAVVAEKLSNAFRGNVTATVAVGGLSLSEMSSSAGDRVGSVTLKGLNVRVGSTDKGVLAQSRLNELANKASLTDADRAEQAELKKTLARVAALRPRYAELSAQEQAGELSPAAQVELRELRSELTIPTSDVTLDSLTVNDANVAGAKVARAQLSNVSVSTVGQDVTASASAEVEGVNIGDGKVKVDQARVGRIAASRKGGTTSVGAQDISVTGASTHGASVDSASIAAIGYEGKGDQHRLGVEGVAFEGLNAKGTSVASGSVAGISGYKNGNSLGGRVDGVDLHGLRSGETSADRLKVGAIEASAQLDGTKLGTGGPLGGIAKANASVTDFELSGAQHGNMSAGRIAGSGSVGYDASKNGGTVSANVGSLEAERVRAGDLSIEAAQVNNLGVGVTNVGKGDIRGRKLGATVGLESASVSGVKSGDLSVGSANVAGVNAQVNDVLGDRAIAASVDSVSARRVATPKGSAQSVNVSDATLGHRGGRTDIGFGSASATGVNAMGSQASYVRAGDGSVTIANDGAGGKAVSGNLGSLTANDIRSKGAAHDVTADKVHGSDIGFGMRHGNVSARAGQLSAAGLDAKVGSGAKQQHITAENASLVGVQGGKQNGRVAANVRHAEFNGGTYSSGHRDVERITAGADHGELNGIQLGMQGKELSLGVQDGQLRGGHVEVESRADQDRTLKAGLDEGTFKGFDWTQTDGHTNMHVDNYSAKGVHTSIDDRMTGTKTEFNAGEFGLDDATLDRRILTQADGTTKTKARLDVGGVHARSAKLESTNNGITKSAGLDSVNIGGVVLTDDEQALSGSVEDLAISGAQVSKTDATTGASSVINGNVNANDARFRVGKNDKTVTAGASRVSVDAAGQVDGKEFGGQVTVDDGMFSTTKGEGFSAGYGQVRGNKLYFKRGDSERAMIEYLQLGGQGQASTIKKDANGLSGDLYAIELGNVSGSMGGKSLDLEAGLKVGQVSVRNFSANDITKAGSSVTITQLQGVNALVSADGKTAYVRGGDIAHLGLEGKGNSELETVVRGAKVDAIGGDAGLVSGELSDVWIGEAGARLRVGDDKGVVRAWASDVRADADVTATLLPGEKGEGSDKAAAFEPIGQRPEDAGFLAGRRKKDQVRADQAAYDAKADAIRSKYGVELGELGISSGYVDVKVPELNTPGPNVKNLWVRLPITNGVVNIDGATTRGKAAGIGVGGIVKGQLKKKLGGDQVDLGDFLETTMNDSKIQGPGPASDKADDGEGIISDASLRMTEVELSLNGVKTTLDIPGAARGTVGVDNVSTKGTVGGQVETTATGVVLDDFEAINGALDTSARVGKMRILAEGLLDRKKRVRVTVDDAHIQHLEYFGTPDQDNDKKPTN